MVVVDEAVLALTGYRLPDPLEVFYAQRSADVCDHRLRSHVLLARPEDLASPAEGKARQGWSAAWPTPCARRGPRLR